MSVRRMIIGAALFTAVAIPLEAQERGSMEFGAFLSSNSFDDMFEMNNAIGFGGRIGAFLDPRWAIEFEGNGGTAGRPGTLGDRSFRFIDARVLFVPVKVGRAQLIVGAGAGHVDANVNVDFTDHSYGYHALLGGKLAIGENAALRLDGVQYFNGGARHRSLRAGLSLYRHPAGKETTVYRTTQAAPAAQRQDSVSAAETRRLRQAAADLQTLRDSLARARTTPPPAGMSAANTETMREMIQFGNDESSLSDSAQAILRDKVSIFRANPEMRIVITGYASTPGTASYNNALGLRRATAAKEFLVSQGIAANRIEIATRGANDLLVEGPSDVANAANRRGQFRILLAEPGTPRP